MFSSIKKLGLKNSSILTQISFKSTNENDNHLLKLLLNRSRFNHDKKSNPIRRKCQLTTSAKTQCDFGFVFDIDGVLVRGKTLLPQTKHMIKLLTDKHGNFKIPTIFLTNAGNELKGSKAAKMSKLLGIKIEPDQVVMSHSPLKLLKNFHNKRCLISGQGPVVEIAKNLGFTSVITIDELRQYHPNLDVVDHKRRNFAPCVLGRYFPPIEAIVLFGESIRWETSLQLILDVIMSNGFVDHAPKRFPDNHLPILACNADMVWMAEATMPRFGHGTFLHCLEQIYEKLSGRELKYSAIVGKPNEISYYYAENVLNEHAQSIGFTNPIKRMYAIGDNLDTDIYGANIYNQILVNNKRSREKKLLKQENSNQSIEESSEEFLSQAESITSILVRTGVFQGDINDHNVNMALAHKDMILDASLIKPHIISDDCLQAVKTVFEIENFKHD
ncbi:unnamed protein product [Brachionus calyciflorus]|uniref:Haloacid dehalogenase-like hydrolase domain-containing 5 n=1 Tax=Brachionus calyciflorus TaxID=104777 RepID=A0A813VEP8_9BILA|nr:unnamed protein product [Brachionus calyciflorus]